VTDPGTSAQAPSGWTVTTLENQWTVIDCKHLTADFVPNGYPVVSIGELQDRYVNLAASPRTTERFYALLTQGGRNPRPRDLIMSRNATVGRISQVLAADPPFAMGQDVCLLRPKRESSDPAYLRALFQSSAVGRQFDSLMAGSTFKRLNVQQIKQLEIVVPPSEEQARIAETLTDVDDLVLAFERLITKKQAVKQGMMQQLLTGQVRLPGFSADWVVTCLGRLIGALEAGVSVNSTVEFGPDAVLKTSAVAGGKFLPEECKTIADRDRKRAKVNPVANSLIISRMNTPALVGEIAYVDSDWPSLFLPDRLWLARPVSDSLTDMRWLSYVLSWPAYSRRLKQLATGTSGSMKNIAKNSLLNLRVPCPSPKEQRAIAAVLADVDDEIETLYAKLSKAHAIKLGMMQQLLTGRTRLPIAKTLT
jgi:type I restriction enzyme, S subunit